MTMPTPPQTVEQYSQALRAEWGAYVALVPIFFEGVRAFNAGDPVPASHVESGLVSTEQVAKTTTKAGRAAAGVDENPKG